MKKLICILLFFILLCTGCNNTDRNNIKDTYYFSYDNIDVYVYNLANASYRYSSGTNEKYNNVKIIQYEKYFKVIKDSEIIIYSNECYGYKITNVK